MNPNDHPTPPPSEIERLRRRLARLEGIERRCQAAEAALQALTERTRQIGDSASLGIFTIDREGLLTGINRRMRELFAWLASDGGPPENLFDCPAMAASGVLADMRRCIDQNTPIPVEYPYTAADGARIHLRYSLSPIPDSDGTAGGLMAIVEDHTALKRAEQALRESERRYRQLFRSAPMALIEWDVSRLKAYLDRLREAGVADFRRYLEQHPDQVHHCWSLIRTSDYNQAFLSLMGVERDIAPDSAFLPTDAEDFLPMAREIILMVAAGKAAVEREQTLLTTSGERKTVLAKSLVISGHEETLARVAIAMLDISQRKRAEAALRESERRFREQALRDGLTGLYNQRYLYQSLARWIDHCSAELTPVSLVFLDMDHFKAIVDAHGHLNGSRAIQQVARIIAGSLTDPAFAVAYAGDEFVVVLPGMGPEAAREKASEIRLRIREAVYVLEPGIEVRLTASFGIATHPQHAADLNGLIAAADNALFSVKQRGKDGIGATAEP